MSTQIPIVSGAQPTGGHLQEFNTTPLAFLHRAYAECGEVSQFDLGGLRTVLLVGPPAHEAFFRAADEQLSRELAINSTERDDATDHKRDGEQGHPFGDDGTPPAS